MRTWEHRLELYELSPSDSYSVSSLLSSTGRCDINRESASLAKLADTMIARAVFTVNIFSAVLSIIGPEPPSSQP